MRTWLKDNLLTLLIGCLVTAFFVHFETTQRQERLFMEEIRERFDSHEKRILALEYITILTNSDLNEWQKEALLEYARKRGMILESE